MDHWPRELFVSWFTSGLALCFPLGQKANCPVVQMNDGVINSPAAAVTENDHTGAARPDPGDFLVVRLVEERTVSGADEQLGNEVADHRRHVQLGVGDR